MCAPAPACRSALEEATRLWPTRSRAADGTCASPKHTAQNPGSDHEPDADGLATAFDLTDDKSAGCDADALAELVRLARDPRIKYVIAERRMYSSYPTSSHAAWSWRPYSGSNPHTGHVHFSIVRGARFDTGAWWAPLLAPEADMTDAERKQLATIHHHIAGDADEGARLPRLMRQVAALEKRVDALENEGG